MVLKPKSINCIMLRTSAMAIVLNLFAFNVICLCCTTYLFMFLCDIRDMMASQIFPIQGFLFFPTEDPPQIYFTMSTLKVMKSSRRK